MPRAETADKILQPMILYFLRHGLAAERNVHKFKHDADRPLTAEGKRKLEKIAAAMQRLELAFDLILSSPLVRARQTAEIVASAFHSRNKLCYSEALAPEGATAGVIRALKALDPQPESLLLVGHEPQMSRLISVLLAGDPGCALLLKKGGLCKLELPALRHGRCAILHWLLAPKQMSLMAG